MLYRTICLAGTIALGVAAVFVGLWGLFVIGKAFDEYQDSPDATYFIVGGFGLVLAAVLAGIAVALAGLASRWLWPLLLVGVVATVALMQLTGFA